MLTPCNRRVTGCVAAGFPAGLQTYETYVQQAADLSEEIQTHGSMNLRLLRHHRCI